MFRNGEFPSFHVEAQVLQPLNVNLPYLFPSGTNSVIGPITHLEVWVTNTVTRQAYLDQMQELGQGRTFSLVAEAVPLQRFVSATNATTTFWLKGPFLPQATVETLREARQMKCSVALDLLPKARDRLPAGKYTLALKFVPFTPLPGSLAAATARLRATENLPPANATNVWTGTLRVADVAFEVAPEKTSVAPISPAAAQMVLTPDAGGEWKNPPPLPHGVDTPANLLCAAASRGDCPAVERLLNEGTPTDARNADGQSALELAVAGGHQDAALLLLGRGAPLWGQNKQGESLLHVAVRAKRCDMVELLLALGVPQGLANAKGRTPLDLARRLEEPGVVDAFVSPPLVQALQKPRPVDPKPIQQEIDKHRRVNVVQLAPNAGGLVLATDGERGWAFRFRCSTPHSTCLHLSVGSQHLGSIFSSHQVAFSKADNSVSEGGVTNHSSALCLA